MKKFIYTAAITAFAASILSSAYAADIGRAYRKDALNRLFLQEQQEEAEKAKTRALDEEKAREAAIEIRKDKERGNSLVEELISKIGSEKLSGIAPGGFTLELGTGVSSEVTFGENGIAVYETFSPGKRSGRKSLTNSPTHTASQLMGSESGHFYSVESH